MMTEFIMIMNIYLIRRIKKQAISIDVTNPKHVHMTVNIFCKLVVGSHASIHHRIEPQKKRFTRTLWNSTLLASLKPITTLRCCSGTG